MIFRLALRSLLTHPVRTLVLACGFGLGVGVMAMLLGVGEVILDQARSPALSGAGDVVIASHDGQLPAARWIMSSGFRTGDLDERIKAMSPSRRTGLYLVKDGKAIRVRGQGGIPSLERAVGDAETSNIAAWTDVPSDAAWSSPDPGAALMALDRFHPVPDVPERVDSWAEWLYFNGRAGENRFYLTFMAGPAVKGRRHRPSGLSGDFMRDAGVRLQLDHGGNRMSFSQRQHVAAAEILTSAPNLTIGTSRVTLNGMRYHISLDLPAEPGGKGRVTGDVFIDATPGRALPPLTIRGAGGWLSGYVVPVMSGRLSGTLMVNGTPVTFEDGAGYHDHNWGFWQDVSWRWGQVQHGDLSVVYGRIRPPADAADPERIPGFLAAIGPNGPEGYSTNVTIEEQNDPATGQPGRIVVSGRSDSLDLVMELDVNSTIATRTGGRFFGGGSDFLQMRATYHVRGRAGDRAIDFNAPGSAETFIR
jgi:hypothetical protein